MACAPTPLADLKQANKSSGRRGAMRFDHAQKKKVVKRIHASEPPAPAVTIRAIVGVARKRATCRQRMRSPLSGADGRRRIWCATHCRDA